MISNENFMPMILSESHRATDDYKKKNQEGEKIIRIKMSSFRWQQWRILGNERKFDPVDENYRIYQSKELFTKKIYDSLECIQNEYNFKETLNRAVPAKACASSRGNTGGAA